MVKKQSLDGNFTLKENFHLTLKFIGEVNPEDIRILKEAIDQVTNNRKKIDLVLSKIGQFSRGKKAIIWLGVNENKFLLELHKELENYLNEKGFPKEKRRFTPHITLGREVILKDKLSLNIRKQYVTIKKISLMESTRIKGKLAYIPLYTRELI